jgi:zinc protease
MALTHVFGRVFLLILASGAFAARGAEPSAAPRKVTTVEGITEYEFANGLRLLLLPDPSQPKVTVNMTVLVGSRHEGYGETGMAHLLEHMVFKGTPTHPNVPKALQDRGAKFNGSTSTDRTNYFETLTASDENLEFAIRLEADRLVNSFVRKEDLDSEMTVVRNEFEMGENSPTDILSQRVAAVAYEWHNYGKSTIGNRSDIERVPIENLRAFYRRFYQPDNMVLIIAGQFTEPKVLELVQKYFGAIPRPQRKLDITYTEEPAQDGERTVTLRRVGSVGAVEVVYHIPAGSHADIVPLQVLANVLDMRPSGRLYKSLVETKKATRVSAYASADHDPSLFFIQAAVADAALLDEVRETICRTVEELGTAGVAEEEVTRARQQLLAARKLSASDVNSLAIGLSEWVSQGDWRLYFLHRDRLEQVSAAQVQAVAQRYLQRNNRTVGMFIPTKQAERVAVPATPNVAELVADYRGRAAEEAGEAFVATPANIESRVQRMLLPEGIKATLLPKQTRGNDVFLLLTLRYGNAENLKGLNSAADFLPDLMLRGTKQLSDQQIQDELAKLGARLSSGSGGGRRGGGSAGGGGLGSASFSIQAKRDTLPAVLQILRQVLREATLPADQFDVMKRSRLAGIEEMRTEPMALAARWLQRQVSVYPKDDVRYVPTLEESIERLQQASHEQVVQLYRDYLGSQAGELTIVGDFDSTACLAILRETFAGWRAPQAYARIEATVTYEGKEVTHRIATPDKANAVYASGLVFPLRDDDVDYPALYMANYIFGGGSLASRLGTRVRQQEGLSYGVSSSFNASSLDARASFVVNAICNPQNAEKLSGIVLEELARLLEQGVAADELEQAKKGFLQNQQVARTSDSALAAMLNAASHADRTLQFDAELERKIGELTPEQIQAVARKYWVPRHLATVVAGDLPEK